MTPYDEGRAAYETDQPRDTNPYLPLSGDWNDWQKGWFDAEEDHGGYRGHFDPSTEE